MFSQLWYFILSIFLSWGQNYLGAGSGWVPPSPSLLWMLDGCSTAFFLTSGADRIPWWIFGFPWPLLLPIQHFSHKTCVQLGLSLLSLFLPALPWCQELLGLGMGLHLPRINNTSGSTGVWNNVGALPLSPAWTGTLHWFGGVWNGRFAAQIRVCTHQSSGILAELKAWRCWANLRHLFCNSK